MRTVNYLESKEIKHNIVIIKINQLYRKDMTSDELYEATRGIWKRRIESVEDAEFALSVYKGKVVEVYRIDAWYPAGTISMKTRVLDENRCIGRIEFTGEVAEESVRNYYLNKDVSGLFKYGEASPVKMINRSEQ